MANGDLFTMDEVRASSSSDQSAMRVGGTMNSSKFSNPKIRGQAHRPMGILALCACDIVFAVLVVLWATRFIRYPDQVWALPVKYLAACYLISAIGIFVGAVLAWRGLKSGRNLLLFALTGATLLYIWDNIGVVLDLVKLQSGANSLSGRAWWEVTTGARAFLWLALNYLYLLRRGLRSSWK
jgi:hypothetical protein